MRNSSIALLLTTALLCSSALAQTHEVKMLTRSATAGMVYEPDYLQIAPGDTVKFIPTQSGHNAATLPELLPEGAQPFKGKINQEIEQTFTIPGLYGIQCIPHLAMGMVMLIQVGDTSLSKLSVPDDVPEQAKQRFQDIAARAQAATL